MNGSWEKDRSLDVSQVQKEATGWELPPSQGDHDLLKATPDTIQEYSLTMQTTTTPPAAKTTLTYCVGN